MKLRVYEKVVYLVLRQLYFTQVVLKFTGLSVYVQYFTQNVIQIIIQRGINLGYTFVHNHVEFNIILQYISIHTTHEKNSSCVIELCCIIISVQTIKIVRNFCDA